MPYITDQQTYELLNMSVGNQIDIKPRFITYSFYRKSKDVWEISQTADGWQTVNIDKADILELNTGSKTFADLNWN